MGCITLHTRIAASPQVCFDLARDVEVHVRSAAGTRERVVGGVRQGLLGPGDEVTFEGVHLGVTFRLTARIVEFSSPERFVDEMRDGPFRSFRHVHEFRRFPGGTLMTDTLTWTCPAGWLGRLADPVVGAYLRRFVSGRNAVLKRLAEAQPA